MVLCNLPKLYEKMSRAGVYIHIPFCRARCSYCDFATGMFESDAAERYVQALTREISEWNEISTPAEVDTIYFGGGTPSLLSVGQIETILSAVAARFNIKPGAEITLEINPGDGGVTAAVRAETIHGWRCLRINRASFGAQTFD